MSNEPENMSIEPVPQPVKVYEGEVVEKTATWEDVRRGWSELRQTWVIGLERIKARMEERARLRNTAGTNQTEAAAPSGQPEDTL